MKGSNNVVWPATSSKFLKITRGPKSLATPVLYSNLIHQYFFGKSETGWSVLQIPGTYNQVYRHDSQSEKRRVMSPLSASPN